MAKVTCYLQLKVEADRLPKAGWKVMKAVPVRMTQRPPSTLEDGVTQVVEVNIDIPDSRLLPIEVAATLPELQFQAEFKAFLQDMDEDV